MSSIVEFFGYHVNDRSVDWKKVIKEQNCHYTGKRSIKVRKSQPEIAIGTVVIRYGKEQQLLIIDPDRFLEKGKVFTDCIHLLTKHEPGNELHLVPEVRVPGGHVDFFLVSVHRGKVSDFVGIELQSLDTTGSLWEERQKLLVELDVLPKKTMIKKQNFGINWKMTAKTILVQLHHKILTFEHLNKNLVLVLQDKLLEYMEKEFNFSSFDNPAKLGDSMHIHAYTLNEYHDNTKLELSKRISTDSTGLSEALGLRAEAQIELDVIIRILESKICSETLFNPLG